MILKEINKQNWKVSKDLKVTPFFVKYIPREEQECHINISREDNIAYVDCSFQSMIIKLSHSAFFTLQEAVVTDETSRNFILSIRGTLKLNGFSIRKNQRKITEKQKKELVERMKGLHQKK
jgi:hypothetical protein